MPATIIPWSFKTGSNSTTGLLFETPVFFTGLTATTQAGFIPSHFKTGLSSVLNGGGFAVAIKTGISQTSIAAFIPPHTYTFQRQTKIVSYDALLNQCWGVEDSRFKFGTLAQCWRTADTRFNTALLNQCWQTESALFSPALLNQCWQTESAIFSPALINQCWQTAKAVTPQAALCQDWFQAEGRGYQALMAQCWHLPSSLPPTASLCQSWRLAGIISADGLVQTYRCFINNVLVSPSSVTCSLGIGQKTRLSATIPAPNLDLIHAGATIRLEHGVFLPDFIDYIELFSAQIDTVKPLNNGAISLTATAEPVLKAPKSVQINKIMQVNGDKRRCLINRYLRLGDTAVMPDLSLSVSQISYTIAPANAYMEIS